MDSEFKWNKSKDKMAFEVTGGNGGRLFLANEAKRLMDPYVPARNLVLAQNVRTYVENGDGIVHYISSYAHYQWEGELYVSSVTGSSYASQGEHKIPTGRKLKQDTFRHPLATSHWDQAMNSARKQDLAKAYEKYLKGKK